MNPEYSDEYLQHYGVLGMRWGVRKGNASQAFARSAKKAQRLEKRYNKKADKAVKRQAKAEKQLSKVHTVFGHNPKRARRALKAQSKAARANIKATKAQNKIIKWEDNMAKEFANVKIKDISPEHLNIGRDYVHMLMK